MIHGIGIDTVEIKRFINWVEWPKEKLFRVFSEEELTYSFSIPEKTIERLAARWATKEAFFKAINQTAPQNNIPFLTLCRLISVQSKKNMAPVLLIDWQSLQKQTTIPLPKSPKTFLSITHTKENATVFIIIEHGI